MMTQHTRQCTSANDVYVMVNTPFLMQLFQLIGLVYLMAYQLLMGYFMPKFDSFLYV